MVLATGVVLPFPAPAGFPIETTKAAQGMMNHPYTAESYTQPHIFIDYLPRKYYNGVRCSKNTVVWDGGIVLHGGVGGCRLPRPAYMLLLPHVVL